MYIPLAVKVLFCNISDIYLHLTIAYWTKTDENKDTLVHTIVPMSSTKEVFMSTRFQNSGMKELVNDTKCTYLKTPAGLCRSNSSNRRNV